MAHFICPSQDVNETDTEGFERAWKGLLMSKLSKFALGSLINPICQQQYYEKILLEILPLLSVGRRLSVKALFS